MQQVETSVVSLSRLRARLGHGSQGPGAQGLGPGPPRPGPPEQHHPSFFVVLKTSPGGRQAKGWETAETAAEEVGAWGEAGTGYPPSPPPPPRPPPAFLGCKKRRGFSPSPLLKLSNTPPKVGGFKILDEGNLRTRSKVKVYMGLRVQGSGCRVWVTLGCRHFSTFEFGHVWHVCLCAMRLVVSVSLAWGLQTWGVPSNPDSQLELLESHHLGRPMVTLLELGYSVPLYLKVAKSCDCSYIMPLFALLP